MEIDIEHVRKTLTEIVQDMRESEEREREAPRNGYIARAQHAGFTVEQAEFLWQNRPRRELLY